MEKKTSKKNPKQIPETQAECACFFRDLAFLVKKEAHPGQGLCLHAPLHLHPLLTFQEIFTSKLPQLRGSTTPWISMETRGSMM